MSAMFSGVALSPAMIAAGSPGAKCTSRNTPTATTTMTGTIDRRRRTMAAVMAAEGSGLRYVPERNHAWHMHPVAGALAIRDRLHPLAEIHVRHDIPRVVLDFGGDALAVVVGLGGEPLRPQFLVLGVGR